MRLVIFKNRILKKFLSVGLSVLALCITLSPTVSVKASDNVTLWYSVNDNYIPVSTSQYSNIDNYWDLVFQTVVNATELQYIDVERIFSSIDGFDTYYSSYSNEFSPEVLCNVYAYGSNQYVVLFQRSDLVLPTSIYFDSNGLNYPQYEYHSFYPQFFIATQLYMTVGTYYGIKTSWELSYNNQFGFSDLVSSSPANSIKAYLITYSNGSASSTVCSVASLNPPQNVWYHSCACRSFDIPYFEDENNTNFVNRSGSGVAGFYDHGTFKNYSNLSSPFRAIYDSDHVLTISRPLYPEISGIPTVLPTISPTPLPIGYDVGIDGMSDGSTLGFLQYLKDTLGTITEIFTPVMWISASIGYIYHYCPWAKILLFIPLIAFLAFLIGRTRS